MFVRYTGIAQGDGSIHYTIFVDGYSMECYYPNESVWMVPGTVDPRDD